jgi:hypothetical protein
MSNDVHAGAGAAGDAGAADQRRCLLDGVERAAAAGVERRHEALLERAEAELGLMRSYAEEVYGLAEEEGLEPSYAFLLVQCGVGVRELEEPKSDPEGDAVQQAPPEWVGRGNVKLADVEVERRLRATFRRLRSHLERAASPRQAVEAFLAEPDVGEIALR